MVETYTKINMSILKKGLHPIIPNGEMIEENSLFMEDGVPCNTTKVTQDWLRKKCIKSLPWPNQSSDMNPIYLLWGIMDWIVCKKNKKV